jgi:hypothetical protein
MANTSGAPLRPLPLLGALLAATLLSSRALADGAADAARITQLGDALARTQAQLQELVQENRALRAAQERFESELHQLAAAAVAPAAAGAAVPPAVSPLPASRAVAAAGESPRLWGYGEMYYAAPTPAGSHAQADLARAVFGLGYSFDERTEFNSEYEVEHAVASAGDAGEFEVEQFYVARALSDALSVRGGLFLMPFGLLNEHHEPTHFYGVQRNFIETLIIPSTWREGGLGVHGTSDAGFGWDAGLTTGFNLSKWDFTPAFPQYASALALEDSDAAPLQATHQELALADARHLAQYAAVSYFGLPALLVGAALSSGESPSPGDPRVTLWETHARWTPGRFDLTGLYARGTITHLASVNAAHPGAVNPLPSAFYGYFLQGAWQAWERGDTRAAPFIRWERYDLGARYAGTAGPAIPGGPVPLAPDSTQLGYWPADHDRVWTAGANLYLGAHLVLKSDYQWFQVNQSFRRFDLGLGVSF